MVTLSARMQANTLGAGTGGIHGHQAGRSDFDRDQTLRFADHHARRADGFDADGRGHIRIRRAIENLPRRRPGVVGRRS